MSTLICHTAGCLNDGVPVAMELSYDVTDEWGAVSTVTVGGVSCGPCGQPITDITDAEPAQP